MYFLYISPAHFSCFLPFRLFVIFIKYFNNKTPFDNSVYYTDRVIHTGLFFSIATWLAQLDKGRSGEWEAAGSSPGQTNTQGR